MLPSSETSLGSTQNSMPNPARSSDLAVRDGTPHGLLITSPSVMESSRRPPPPADPPGPTPRPPPRQPGEAGHDQAHGGQGEHAHPLGDHATVAVVAPVEPHQGLAVIELRVRGHPQVTAQLKEPVMALAQPGPAHRGDGDVVHLPVPDPPADAVPGLQHHDIESRVLELAGRRDPGKACSDHANVGFYRFCWHRLPPRAITSPPPAWPKRRTRPRANSAVTSSRDRSVGQGWARAQRATGERPPEASGPAGDAAVPPGGAVAVGQLGGLGSPQADVGDGGFGAWVRRDEFQPGEEPVDLLA